MGQNQDAERAASSLLLSVGLLRRRLQQTQSDLPLTLPEIAALARLDRDGPTTSSALAKLEQISPQSMGSTLGGLEARGLVKRAPDPSDGRRVLLSPTDAGHAELGAIRSARAGQLAQVMQEEFTRAELRTLGAAAPLIERLAEKL